MSLSAGERQHGDIRRHLPAGLPDCLINPGNPFMLLSHRHKFIFLKSTKTGGTSVEMLLEPLCLPPNASLSEVRPQHVSKYGIVGRRAGAKRLGGNDTWFSHMPAKAIRDLVAPEIWESYAKITVVRNPFSRVLSAFRFMHRRSGRTASEFYGDEIAAFDAWVLENYPFMRVPVTNMVPGSFEAEVAAFDAWVLAEFPTDPVRPENPAHTNFEEEVAAFDAWLQEGNIMGYKHIVTVGGKVVADHVLRQERLMADLTGMIRDLDLPVHAEDLAHAKRRPPAYDAPPVAEFYNDSRRDLVLKLEGWSFDAFGYSTDPKDA